MDDRLVVTPSFAARYGDGCRRGLVLGGGGVVFVAWLSAYMGELARRGVDLEDADRIVGTSAGALMATTLAAGHLRRLQRLAGPLSRRPAIVSRLAPSGDLKPSQQRALDLFEQARDSEPRTIQGIGAAALAASAPPRNLLPAGVVLITGTWRWPHDRLLLSAVDAFTGERLVLSRASGVPLVRAVAASATVPGLFAPQPIGDRLAMDGGVFGTAVHADLVAGCERVLTFAVAGTLPDAGFTMQPDGLDRELNALRATGTAVEVRHAQLPADTDLMDPAMVGEAFALGRDQAADDAVEISRFWAPSAGL